MAWKKVKIQRENGEWAEAQAPEIISASRSTDIPAFYADWFFHRLKVGYSAWTNPFNGVKSYISYQDTRFIVFWSKNPRPLLKHLPFLHNPTIAGINKEPINCYLQYTLNDYDLEGLEQKVPKVQNRIDTFKRLVEILGFGHVIWRFDPMILTDRIHIEDLLSKVFNIGEQLKGYTEKLVFSFADILEYAKVKRNLENSGINYVPWQEEQMIYFASQLAELNKPWGFELATCGEKEIFTKYGIKKNSCVDDTLMIKLASSDAVLMKYLGVEIHNINENSLGTLFDAPEANNIPSDAILLSNGKYAVKTKNNKDKGQRALCGCMVSKDIGEYNTCPHLCEYCYANANKECALHNYRRHNLEPLSESII